MTFPFSSRYFSLPLFFTCCIVSTILISLFSSSFFLYLFLPVFPYSLFYDVNTIGRPLNSCIFPSISFPPIPGCLSLLYILSVFHSQRSSSFSPRILEVCPQFLHLFALFWPPLSIYTPGVHLKCYNNNNNNNNKYYNCNDFIAMITIIILKMRKND